MYKEGEKQNINNILEIEDSILSFKIQKSQDKNEISSLNAGHERIESAIGCLDNMTSYKNFEKTTKSYGINTVDSRGLPLDDFRTTIPGQITSIRNINRDDKAQYLKNFNQARIDNLVYAEKLYKDLQHKYMREICEKKSKASIITKLYKYQSQSKIPNNTPTKSTALER